MKRIFSIILLALAVSVAASAQFRYAAVAGPTVNSFKFKQDLVGVHQAVGAQAGVLGELMFPGIGFGLDLGLLYNQQSAVVDFADKTIWASQGIGNTHVFIHNVMLPMHLRFKWTRMDGLEEIVAPFISVGPDFNIQVAHGDTHGAVKYSGGDVGIDLGIGAELYKHFQIQASYTWGVTYVMKTTLLENYSARCSQWAVRLAYFF